MKNILVSTDFSDNAHAAVLFAAEIARQNQARLIILHAYHPGILLEEVSIWADPDKLEKDVQERMDKLAREIHTSFGLSVTRLLKPGFAVDETWTIAKKIKADLVVLGTIGAGNHRNGNLGKVSSELLHKLTEPLICVAPEVTLATLKPGDLFSGEAVRGNAAGIEVLQTILAASQPNQAPPQPEIAAGQDPVPAELT